MISPFSRDERDDLLRFRADALASYKKAMTEADKCHPWSDGEQAALAQAEEYLQSAVALEQRYFQRLPRLAMASCPFDGKALYRSFDPYGLDGLWWRSDATPPESTPCTHFCFVAGGIAPGDAPLRAGEFEVAPGPEVPFVIPRVLQLPGMVAVVSEIEMADGARAFPISYFAEKRPPPRKWAASWRRRYYSYVGQLGETGWRTDDESWDFDLLPWLEAGRLRWCSPRDEPVLSQEPAERCPYLDLPGQRERMVIQRDRSWSEGLAGGVTRGVFS